MSTTPQSVDGPLVSVIMPCRDGMPFVGSAVRRVLAQEVPLELLFVDAGSTDGSLQEVTSIDDDRIRVIEAPPGTQPGSARNLAARQARGEVLAFADADDLWRRDKLARQLRLRSVTGAALVYSDCRVIDREGRLLGMYLSRHRPVEGTVTDRLLEENFVPLSTVVVDRKAFECAGAFQAGFRVACDYLFMIRLSRMAVFAFDPESLVDYRIHGRNVTADFRTTYAENVRVLDLLLADEAANLGDARLRRARSLVQWKWAIRELIAGPGSWARARRQARGALRSGGTMMALSTLAAAIRVGFRGFPLRVRMARARAA